MGQTLGQIKKTARAISSRLKLKVEKFQALGPSTKKEHMAGEPLLTFPVM